MRFMLLVALLLCFTIAVFFAAVVPQLVATYEATQVEFGAEPSLGFVYDNVVVPQEPGSGGGGQGVI